MTTNGSSKKALPERSTIKCSKPPEKTTAQTADWFKPQRSGCDDNRNQQTNHFAVERLALTAALGWSFVTSSLAQTPPSAPNEPARNTALHEAGAESVVLPKSVPDPLEPVNRVVYSINKGIMTGVVKPTAKVYRLIVIKPVRTGIGNFGKNITFPGRLINNLLQGKWAGARDETYRFCCNTTVGVAGFIDMASKWNIPKSDADFGQTFGQWGWKPAMLPDAADLWTEQRTGYARPGR